MSFIESRIIPDATVPGLSWRVTVFPDYDVTPSDADCYTPSQVKAWEAGEWQYVGVVVTPVIADTEFDAQRRRQSHAAGRAEPRRL